MFRVVQRKWSLSKTMGTVQLKNKPIMKACYIIKNCTKTLLLSPIQKKKKKMQQKNKSQPIYLYNAKH